MGKINDINTPWNGHTHAEVETFLKEQLNKGTEEREELAESLSGKVGKSDPALEHVVVKIRGNDGNESASVNGGKVYVKSYDPATGFNYPIREFSISQANADEYAVVEFDIRYGLHYTVYSLVSGLGASFRLVFTACKSSREVFLWNCSLGVWKYGYYAVMDEDENYRIYPVLQANGDEKPDSEWDTREDESMDDGGWGVGVLVSTATASFLLMSGNKSSQTLYWSKQNLGRSVPGLEEYFYTNGMNWEAAQAAAALDMEGALNSDKILSSLIDCPAALFASQSNDWMAQQYLPGAGELKTIYNNKAAINSLLADWEGSNIASIDNNSYWSSCAYSLNGAWCVGMNGGYVHDGDKGHTNFVLAVSAFHYYYN